MKSRCLVIAMSILALSFVGCYGGTYRITGLESIGFFEPDTDSRDVWHGHSFYLSAKLEYEAINRRYVRLETLSPIDRCYATSVGSDHFYNLPDLKTVTLQLDKDLIVDGVEYPSGTDIAGLTKLSNSTDSNYIFVHFISDDKMIEIAEGKVTFTFGCMIGSTQMYVSTELTVDLTQ